MGLNPPTYSSKPAEICHIWKMREQFTMDMTVYFAPVKKIHNRNLDSSLSTRGYSANICAQANHTLFVRPLIRKGKHKGGFAVSST